MNLGVCSWCSFDSCLRQSHRRVSQKVYDLQAAFVVSRHPLAVSAPTWSPTFWRRSDFFNYKNVQLLHIFVKHHVIILVFCCTQRFSSKVSPQIPSGSGRLRAPGSGGSAPRRRGVDAWETGVFRDDYNKKWRFCSAFSTRKKKCDIPNSWTSWSFFHKRKTFLLSFPCFESKFASITNEVLSVLSHHGEVGLVTFFVSVFFCGHIQESCILLLTMYCRFQFMAPCSNCLSCLSSYYLVSVWVSMVLVCTYCHEASQVSWNWWRDETEHDDEPDALLASQRVLKSANKDKITGNLSKGTQRNPKEPNSLLLVILDL